MLTERLLAACLISWVVWLPGCNDSGGGAGYEATYYLADHLPESLGQDAGRRSPQAPWIEVGFDRRRAVFQHPPSTYRFDDVPSGSQALFRTAMALSPGARDKKTDGVELIVRCRDTKGPWHTLLQLHLQPPVGPGEPSWIEREMSLAPCGSSTTTLELQTGCGPRENCQWDGAFWGDPRVVFPQVLDTHLRRLVLLLSIDTLRPDRMSLYGARRTTTPVLEELAKDAIVFDKAVAPSPWTVPSHASLLTSTDPDVHGATTQRDIGAGVSLLSEVLQQAGWTTAGFVDTPWLGTFGFPRGYDHYDAEKPPAGSSRRGVGVTRERLVQWLATAQGDAFVFWHVMDVHGPYGAPAPFGGRYRHGVEVETPDRRLEELRQLAYHDYLALDRYRNLADLVASYDEGIAHVDAEIGALLDALRCLGLYEDALIVVTSDHGESFMDHGVWVGHGLFLTDDEIRVPLLVKLPGNAYAGARVSPMVRLIDVAPTVLDVLGLKAPPTFVGQSLVSPRPGAPGAVPRVAFGASTHTGASYVRDNQHKLVTAWQQARDHVISTHLRPREPTPLISRIRDEARLFDLTADPEETTNLLPTAQGQSIAQPLWDVLHRRARWIEDLRQQLRRPEQDVELSPEETRRLKSLGYLGGDGS